MSLFEVRPDGLIPFRALAGGAATYDQALEDVLWSNLDLVIGEPLLRLRRRPSIGGGGQPAVVALDRRGHLVVVYARWEIDRADLTDCLEYAAWARAATEDDIIAMHWRGATEFAADWAAFASGAALQLGSAPRLK